jgi:hypothetical protein
MAEAVGVDTVPELAQRNAANLHARRVEVIEEKITAPDPPSAEDVARRVAEARALPRALH